MIFFAEIPSLSRATRSLKYQGIKKVLIYESFIESGYVIFSPRNVQPIKQPLAGV